MHEGAKGSPEDTAPSVLRCVLSDAFYKHANVQSKAVFSHAMTVMDKTCGWTDEEKWVVSKFAACIWIYTKCVLTEGRKPTPEMQEYLKRRMLPIMLCVNCVCEETLHRVSISSSCSSPKREAMSTVKKNSAILQKAITDRHPRWSKKEWYSKSKPHWRSRMLDKAHMISGKARNPRANGKISPSRWMRWGQP